MDAEFKQAKSTSHRLRAHTMPAFVTYSPTTQWLQVDAEFKQAETAAVLNEERAAQEAELELEEERLARSVS